MMMQKGRRETTWNMLEEGVIQFHNWLEGDVVEPDHDNVQQKVLPIPFLL
jgi:hypothetical protein